MEHGSGGPHARHRRCQREESGSRGRGVLARTARGHPLLRSPLIVRFQSISWCRGPGSASNGAPRNKSTNEVRRSARAGPSVSSCSGLIALVGQTPPPIRLNNPRSRSWAAYSFVNESPARASRHIAPPATRSDSLDHVGSVFGRACRFDQFSTVSPLKRAKSLSFVVASTSPCTWAIAAI